MRKTINERLRKLRETNGLTLQKVADAMGIATPSLSVIDTGKVHPSLYNIIRYADACGYDVEINFVKKGEACEDLLVQIPDDLRRINGKRTK